ncbi:MAG TPA: ribokinase [Coprothermobacter sp.]|jgi:ribokinase|nr:ribokinase [Coprothermobacter sp.]
MKAVVIGSMNMDFTMDVDHLPSKGETVPAVRLRTSPGGKGLNQAVALARLGAEVLMVGAVGNDASGEVLLDNLPKDRIPDFSIKKVDDSTGNAFITVDSQGNNTIVVYPGANYKLDIGWVESFKGEIESSDFVVLQMEIPVETVIASIELAHNLNTKVVLNPAPALPLPEYVCTMVDLIIPNETELALLTDESNVLEGARKLLKMGAKAVVVTLGSEGCLYKDANQEISVEGFKVNAIDSTAAGDAFIGGLLTALGRHEDIGTAMKFANAVGAITVTRLGAQESIPTYEEVEEFLRRREL